MEIDHFKLQLTSYLRDHGFDNEDLEAAIVHNNAEQANNTFEEMRRSGSSVDEAIEFAVSDLYKGIGDSPREVLAEVLLNNYKKRLNLNDQKFLEFWIQKISQQTDIMNEFKLKDGLGLDPEILNGSRADFISRIDQYLNINGL